MKHHFIKFFFATEHSKATIYTGKFRNILDILWAYAVESVVKTERVHQAKLERFQEHPQGLVWVCEGRRGIPLLPEGPECPVREGEGHEGRRE